MFQCITFLTLVDLPVQKSSPLKFVDHFLRGKHQICTKKVSSASEIANSVNNDVKNYNISMSIRNGKWKCFEDSGHLQTTVSENNIVTISLREKASSNDESDLIEEPRSYGLRHRKNVQQKLKIEPNIPVTMTTVSEVCVSFKKRNLKLNCKKLANKAKLVENAILFAKQAGYAPWSSRLINFTKNRSSATVMYYGFNNFTGSVKLNEIVQMYDESKEAIGELITFTLKSKSIREFPCFLKAVREIQGAMGYSSFD